MVLNCVISAFGRFQALLQISSYAYDPPFINHKMQKGGSIVVLLNTFPEWSTPTPKKKKGQDPAI